MDNSKATKRAISSSSKKEKFKEIRDDYLRRLASDDENSIQRQIIRILWNDAAFRVINKSRSLAKKDDKGNIELNGMVHRLIDTCFSQSQAISMRRLLDKYPAEGERGVYSLYQLLVDIEDNICHFTRENIFAAEDIPYDLENAKKKCSRYIINHENAGKEVPYIPRDIDYQCSEKRHNVMDKLSGVTNNNRSADDTIRKEIVIHFKAKLPSSNEITTYVDKFIAHAATPESRASKNADDITLTLGKLRSTQEAICKVANFVARYILGSEHILIFPIPQYNLFRYIDRPLIESANIETLRQQWRQCSDDTLSWANWTIEDVQKEMGIT